MHGWLPLEVFAACSPETQAEEMAIYSRDLDRGAAELLEIIADHHRRDWADAKFAVFARSVLRMVAAQLRDPR